MHKFGVKNIVLSILLLLLTLFIGCGSYSFEGYPQNGPVPASDVISIVRQDMSKFVLAVFYMFLGVFFCIAFVLQRRQRIFLFFALFLLAMANFILSITDLKWLFADIPIMWFSTEPLPIFITFMGFPVVYYLFLDQVFGPGFRRLTRWLWQIHAAYGVSVLLLFACSVIYLDDALPILIGMIFIGNVYVISYTCLRAAHLSKHGILFIVGLLGFIAGITHDCFMFVGWIPGRVWVSHWGLLLWVLCVLIVLGRQWLRHGLFRGSLRHILTPDSDPESKPLTVTSAVSHSIKNEMNKIQYLTDRLKKSLHSFQYEVASGSVDELYHVTNHVQLMVNKIREFSAELVLQEESVEIASLVDEALLLVQPYAEKNRMEMIRQYSSEQMVVTCDPVYVKDCMVNICFNAIEAMKPDSGILQVRLGSYRKGARIQFQDNGTGIPESDMTRILEPFYSTKGRSEHFGLGLSYCEQVMHKHDGLLELDSEPGAGTCVSLQFPRYRTRFTKPGR